MFRSNRPFIWFAALFSIICVGCQATQLEVPVTHTDGHLSKNHIRSIEIVDFDVVFDGVTPVPVIREQLLSQLRQKVTRCDGSQIPARLVVTIEGYTGVSGASVLIGGGAVSISGFAKFLSPENKELLAEYYLDVSVLYAGLTGAAQAADEVDQLASTYATKICDRIFARNA